MALGKGAIHLRVAHEFGEGGLGNVKEGEQLGIPGERVEGEAQCARRVGVVREMEASLEPTGVVLRNVSQLSSGTGGMKID